MNIYDKNTEELLKRKLNSGLSAFNKFALHIKGDRLPSVVFDKLPTILTSWFGEESGEIYICQDRDLFFFSNNIDAKSYEIFDEHFSSVIGKGINIPTTEYLSQYDLGKNLIVLKDYVEHKCEKIRQLSKDTKPKEILSNGDKSENFEALVNHNITNKRMQRNYTEIMIVEDDAFTRRLLRTALEKHEVNFAEDGQTALKQYVRRAPDITFLDIGLPDSDGLQLLKRILKYDPDACIVMLSGNSAAEKVREAMIYGAKGFVGKPFSKDKLLKYISKYSRRLN